MNKELRIPKSILDGRLTAKQAFVLSKIVELGNLTNGDLTHLRTNDLMVYSGMDKSVSNFYNMLNYFIMLGYIQRDSINSKKLHINKTLLNTETLTIPLPIINDNKLKNIQKLILSLLIEKEMVNGNQEFNYSQSSMVKELGINSYHLLNINVKQLNDMGYIETKTIKLNKTLTTSWKLSNFY